MADLGYIALLLALVVAIYGTVVSIIGGYRSDGKLSTSGRNALYVVAALVTISSLALVYLLITNDFFCSQDKRVTTL